MSKLKVLFFAADPLSVDGASARLRLDEEAKRIEEAVRAALHRDRVQFRTCWATSTQDMGRELLNFKPDVVHFSGHGSPRGLVLVSTGDSGATRADAAALKSFFKAYPGRIRVVVLNACDSGPQAKAIAEVVGCAIGTPAPISDAAAVQFSAAFYSSITFGQTVQAAFDQARATLRMEQVPEGELPQLEVSSPAAAQRVLVRPSRMIPLVTAGALMLVCGGATIGYDVFVDTPTEIACQAARAAVPAHFVTAMPDAAHGLMSRSVASASAAGAATNPMATAKDLYAAGDYENAFPLFKQAAIAGDIEAMGFMGTAYLRGEGTVANPDSTRTWLDRAAKERDARGMNAKGDAFQRGFGFNQSYGWARHWYRKAAQKGYAEAMHNLGTLLRDGLGGPVRPDSALALYAMGAKAGDGDAMVDAGMIYEKGLGVPANLDVAQCWYEPPANAGLPRAMVALGQLHEHRLEYGEALELYQKAADMGFADAMNNLGVLYLNGWGVQADRAKAMEWLSRAAAAGSTIARSNLDSLRIAVSASEGP